MSGPIGARAGQTPVSPRQLEVHQIGSRQTAQEHIDRLAAKGMVLRHPHIARGITLTAAARELLARERARTAEGKSQ